MAIMKCICMWCNEVVGEKNDEGTGHTVTSTCCEPCVRIHYPDIAEQVIAEKRLREVQEEKLKQLVA